MLRAVSLAWRGGNRVSPNPRVGALVVKDGKILGEGWHRALGGPHAEVFALEAAGDLARGADLYVTLEPCSHQGRTPACAPQIVAAGIRRVFFANTDPNPLVSGQGHRMLEAAGIQVYTGLCRMEAGALNQGFFKWMQHGLPTLTLKSAQTLDAFAAQTDGSSRWISGGYSRKTVHRIRSRADGIMVGIGTVLADDPQLNVRAYRGQDPHRIIWDPSFSLKPGLRLFRQRRAGLRILSIHPPDPPKAYMDLLQTEKIESFTLAEDSRQGWDALFRSIARSGILDILVEGGPRLQSLLLNNGFADRMLLFIAPKMLGEGRPAHLFPRRDLDSENLFVRRRWTPSGEDVLFDGLLHDYTPD